jgi:hypothetical protein
MGLSYLNFKRDTLVNEAISKVRLTEVLLARSISQMSR